MAGDALGRLTHILQSAYSGELAAGLAYRGHWHSVRDPAERERIRTIEAEEWHHRTLVGDILRALGAQPNRSREIIFWCIGRVIGVFCHLSGWFLPMYGAGRLERKNIVEYEEAAECAAESGHQELIDCLLTMAEVEWEHEYFFRHKVLGNPMLRVFKLWDPAPPKETIRAKTPHPAFGHLLPARRGEGLG